MTQDGNLLTLWDDGLPPEAIPAYPSFDLAQAKGGEETWERDTSITTGFVQRPRAAKPGEHLRDPDLRWRLDWSANLLWRQDVLERCNRNASNRELEYLFCKSSILYYINTFCWTYDPRHDSKQIPFVTFPFQDDLLTWSVWLLKHKTDGLIEKSREMGVTWCYIALASWLCNFYPGSVVYPSSLREEDVDNRTEDSLFGKFRYIQRHLPEWMRNGWAERSREHDASMRVIIPDTGAVLRGQKTESTSGRQGRATCLIPDEFAHIIDARAVLEAFASLSPTTFYISTPNGMGNEFARMAHDPAVHKKSLHWTLHPQKNRDWYDREAAKPANTPETMAKEHDIVYEVSTLGRVFPQFRSFSEQDRPEEWCHIHEGGLVEYDPMLDVLTGMDFGIGDPTSVVFAQIKSAPHDYHYWTRTTLVFFDEEEAADLTAFEWRHLVNSKGYHYREHVGDWRSGNARDAAGKTWIKYLSQHIEKPLRSDKLQANIMPGEPPIVVNGRRTSESGPIQTFRELLRTPGAVVFSRKAVPHLVTAIQNWSFPVDKETRRPIGDKPNHDQWSHACKAMLYLVDWLYGSEDKTLGRQLPAWDFPAFSPRLRT